MSLKSFSLFALSIFTLVFVMGIASAVSLNLVAVSVPTSVNQGTTLITVTFNVSNGGTTNYTALNWSGSSSNVGSWTTLPTLTALNISEEKTLSATLTIPSTFSGNINATIDLQSETTAEAQLLMSITVTPVSVSIPPEVTSCSSTGNPGQLKVKGIDFSNNGMQYNTFGEDDQWFPFEEIEVDIEVENNGNDNVDDVSVEWGIWDTKKDQWIIDLDEEDEINIKDGDQETLTLTFKIDDDMDVDLDELTDGDHYKFYVVATGTVDNDTSPETCVSDYEDVSVIIESDFVILDNFEVPETVSCGVTVTITADAWNIGDSDQDEVSVLVTNSELGIDEDISVGDIDAFDNQQVSLTFTVPGDADEKTYNLDFEVYDEDNDLYENDFDEDSAEFSLPLKVSGSCGAAGTEEVSVVANIVSGGKAGQELVVKATVTNTGASSATYTLSSSKHEAWASSYTVQPSTLTLAAGQSGEATFTFNVNKDAFGEQSFSILLVSGNQVITQPITPFTIEKAGFLGITGWITGDNWYLWGIGILNVLLVIVIIIVAVRIASK